MAYGSRTFSRQNCRSASLPLTVLLTRRTITTMQTEAETIRPDSPSRGARLLWWQLVLVACAVVVALSSIVIAVAELRQADALRKANCSAELQVAQAPSTGDAYDELRRCLGVADRR